MKATSAIATLPRFRFRFSRPAKETEPKDRVRRPEKPSFQQTEWWAAWEADPTMAAMAMIRMFGH